MKRHMILFGVITLMGTGAAFAFANGGEGHTTDPALCEKGCQPECCVQPAGKPMPDCCYDPSCCE